MASYFWSQGRRKVLDIFAEEVTLDNSGMNRSELKWGKGTYLFKVVFVFKLVFHYEPVFVNVSVIEKVLTAMVDDACVLEIGG